MYITNSTMITPLGNDCASISCAIKANISSIQETSYISRFEHPLKMAMVPEDALPLPPEEIKEKYRASTPRQLHLLRLCHSALSDSFISKLPPQPIPLLLAGPDELFTRLSLGLTDGFLKAIVETCELPIDLAASRIFPSGRAGVFQAAEQAFHLMQEGMFNQVILGGVDCFRDNMLIGQLDSQKRILFAGNTSGFAPSEAAAFLLISKEPTPYNASNKLIQLYRPGCASENGSIYSDAIYLGEGLDLAVKQAILFSTAKNIQSVYSSMNGEHYWAKEFGIMMMRNGASMAQDVQIEHPADCFGDVGAAFGAVIPGCLSNEEQGTYLIYGSSDSSHRGAFCVEISKSID